MEKKQREYVKNFHEKKKNTFLKNSELEGMYYETRRSERSVLL